MGLPFDYLSVVKKRGVALPSKERLPETPTADSV